MPASKAAASDPVAEQAATETLRAGGNGIDGVMAGFLAAAGAHDATLLAPMAALIGGVGVGTKCVDGRCAQPGRGSPRPRGWVDGATLPTAAFAATPRSLAALAVLHAHGAARPLAELVRPAARLARAAGASRRAELLQAFGGQGARVLASDRVSRAVLAVAGRTADGLISEADLAEAMPGDEQAPFATVVDDLALATPPWQAEGSKPEAAPRTAEVIVAADSRGMVAALAYCPDPDGVPIPDLELRLAGDAAPVRRGVPRITPGTPRPTSLPIALLRRDAPRWFAAVGIRGASSIEAASLAGAGDPLTDHLERLKQAADGNLAVVASVGRRKTSLTRA